MTARSGVFVFLGVVSVIRRQGNIYRAQIGKGQERDPYASSLEDVSEIGLWQFTVLKPAAKKIGNDQRADRAGGNLCEGQGESLRKGKGSIFECLVGLRLRYNLVGGEKTLGGRVLE